jgi:hypothetical protein
VLPLDAFGLTLLSPTSKDQSIKTSEDQTVNQNIKRSNHQSNQNIKLSIKSKDQTVNQIKMDHHIKSIKSSHSSYLSFNNLERKFIKSTVCFQQLWKQTY